MAHFLYYLFVFLAGMGCGLSLAFRWGGLRALWRLSMRDYAERRKRAGLD